MNTPLKELYDQIPYNSEPITASHPLHLCTVATLLGLNPVLPKKARILELGCARGDNIIGIAASLPESACVGVDLSPRQIETGRELIQQAGLRNIVLKEQSFLTIDKSLGSFDYIIAHGVYSWVSKEAQEKILALCGSLLTQNGIAYISYNTLPGWHIRGFIREMMLFEARNTAAPEQRPGRSRRVLEFMTASLRPDTPFGAMMLNELKHPRSMPDWYLTHDFIAENNNAEYFSNFMTRADAHGLKYVGDAEIPMMFPHELHPAAKQNIAKMSTSYIEREQYTDYLRNRMFRRTILSKGKAIEQPQFSAHILPSFYVATPLALSTSPADGEKMYRHPNGGGLRATNPILDAMFSLLQKKWPQPLAYSELLHEVKAAIPQSDVGAIAKTLADGVLSCYSTGLLELSVHSGSFTSTVSTLPKASSLVRAQAAKGSHVITLRHEAAELTERERSLLLVLDGTRALATEEERIIARKFSKLALFVS